MTEFVPGSERAVLDWIRAHAGPQTTILSIRAGSRVLVETGLLDGHAATGFHGDVAGFKERYPAVRWQAWVRWVDAGQFITSGTLTAGIDATLQTIERLSGRAAAERAGQALGYPHLNRLADPAAEYQPPANPDLGLIPNALYGWGQTNVGVVLYDGISEMVARRQWRKSGISGADNRRPIFSRPARAQLSPTTRSSRTSRGTRAGQ